MRRVYLILIIIVVLAVGVIGWWYIYRTPAVPSYTLDLVGGDTVSEWGFRGAYTGDVMLTKRAEDEIARLEGIFGTGSAIDYELYVSIANQYDLLGDGQNELVYLEKALAIDSTNTGLAWHNAGVLFERLKAYATARFAFEQAVRVQGIPQYQFALSDFLKAHYPGR